MKKQLMTLAATLAFAGSVFGQGQVSMGNNAGSLIRMDNATTGTPVALGSTSFQLYYGAAGTPEANLIALLPIAGVNAAFVGRIAATTIDVPLPPGTAATFQIWAWQSTYTSYALAVAGGGFVGKSGLFNATTSPQISPPPLATSLAGLYPGFAVTGIVPEPSTLVLAGLGVASLLLLRRRK